MNTTKIGAKDFCKHCGKEIVFGGEFWTHSGGWHPRHMATPESSDSANTQHRVGENLKLALMLLGNRLVTEHGFEPANAQWPIRDINAKSTSFISTFTEYLNTHEEAQQILKELGFDWPVSKRP